MEAIAVFQACSTAESHRVMRVRFSVRRATRTIPATSVYTAVLEALRTR